MESVNVKLEVGLTKRSNEDQQQKLKLQGDIPELELGYRRYLLSAPIIKKKKVISIIETL